MADSLTAGIETVKSLRTTLASLDASMRATEPTLSDPGSVYDALNKARLAVANLGEAMARHPDATADFQPLPVP